MIKSIKKAIVDSVTRKNSKLKLFGNEYDNSEIIQALLVIFLTIVVIFISSYIVSSYGFRPIDSIFETTSAIATAGLSVGVVSPYLAFELKWFFVFLMILGRVEILAFLIIFSRKKKT